MSPEALAALHAACFTHPRPWSAAEFAALLCRPGVVLLTQDGAGTALPPHRQGSGEGGAPGGEAGAPPPRPSPTEEGGRRPPPTAGFLLGRVVADEAEVLTLAVDPAARRRGVGALLLARFLAEAAARGATRAFLEVAEDNPAALALYRKAGFAEAGRRRGYAAPGVDAMVLARDMPGI